MKNSVDKILKKSCYKCGMCYAACPMDAIEMQANPNTGFFDFTMNSQLCVDCGKCKTGCPAAEPIHTTGNSIGNYRALALLHSADTAVRQFSTSGGAVNAFVRYLIESRQIDSALMLKENSSSDFECEVVEITAENVHCLLDEPRSFASRYVAYPVLSALKNKKGKRLAIVGTPCQIKAVSKSDFAKHVFKIGIACSGAVSYQATKILKEKLNAPQHRLYYRGDGWPGKNTLILGEHVLEKAHTQSYFEKMFSSGIYKNKACWNCDDQFATAADISFFDFWNEREMKTETIGNSAAIIRSEQANTYLQEAVQQGYIEIQQTISGKEAVASQTFPLLLKEKQLGKKFPLNLYLSFLRLIQTTKLYRCIPLKKYPIFSKLLHKFVNITKRIHHL